MLAASLQHMTHIQLAASGQQHLLFQAPHSSHSVDDGGGPMTLLQVAKLNLTSELFCCDHPVLWPLGQS